MRSCDTPETRLRTAVPVALVFLLGACASGGGAPLSATLVSQEIESARTTSDHERIAAYFERQGRELADRAAEHEAIARSYAGATFGLNDGIWMRHCMSLAAKLRSAAGDSLTLAAMHRHTAAALQR